MPNDFTEVSLSALASVSTSAHNARPLRLALVGCVNAPLFYVAALVSHPHLDLAALVDADRSAARAWSRPLGSRIPVFESVTEMLAGHGDINAALVASPIEERAAHAHSLLSAGIPVLIEPPFAVTLSAADALIDAAVTSGTLIMPAFTRRFEPGIATIGDLLDDGSVGALRQLRCDWRFPSLGTSLEVPADAETRGWGALWPVLACQAADLGRHWLGEAISVSADLDVYEEAEDRRARRMEAFANIIVGHERGHAIHQIARVRSTVPEERYKLTGSHGDIEIVLTGPAAASDEPVQPLLHVFGRAAESVPPRYAEEVDPDPHGGASTVARYRRLLAHFAECVSSGAAPRISGLDLRASLEIACAAVLSSADETKIPLPLRGQADSAASLFPHSLIPEN